MAISLEQTQQRLQSLTEISELLMSAVEPERVVAVILEAATRLFEVEGCSLALLDNVRQELAFVIMAGPAQVDEFRKRHGDDQYRSGRRRGVQRRLTGSAVVRWYRSPNQIHDALDSMRAAQATRPDHWRHPGTQHRQARRVQRRRPAVPDSARRAGWDGAGAYADVREGP